MCGWVRENNIIIPTEVLQIFEIYSKDIFCWTIERKKYRKQLKLQAPVVTVDGIKFRVSLHTVNAWASKHELNLQIEESSLSNSTL